MNEKACNKQSSNRRTKFALVALFIALPKMTEPMVVQSWPERAAIVWDGDNVPKESCYWNRDWLQSLEENGCAISYKTLISVASYITADLRLQLQELAMQQNAGEKDNNPLAIPIAIAIPEGPLLGLSILVVHALNNLIDIGSHNDCFAILVPIEPSEPKTRNMHIIKDTSPCMIFTCSDEDKALLQSMIDDISDEKKVPSLVDFADLVRLAMQRVKSNLTFANTLEELLTENNQLDQEIRTIISTCARLIATNDHEEKLEEIYKRDLSPFSVRSESSPRISHIVYTSGTTGVPKGCISSIESLKHYLKMKNQVYAINEKGKVLLASSLSFDPCLSDCLATFEAKATLVIAPRTALLNALPSIIRKLEVSHVLCTPTLWSLMGNCKPQDFSSLQAIALGGEPIPRQMKRLWARKSTEDSHCRLYATYGVTEACVYQTCGEIFSTEMGEGQYVGNPFFGTKIRLCREDIQDSLVDVPIGNGGEIVLSGLQLDETSGYLKRPELRHKFVLEASSDEKCLTQHYRTGDRGIFDKDNGGLRILGRISGEEGMVKVNGVRVELGEIENALVDEIQEGDRVLPVVLNAMAKISRVEGRSEIGAYCILHDEVRDEVGITNDHDSVLVDEGPLLTLLRARCEQKLKAACIPKSFVIIKRLPLSPTGKRDRKGLPEIDACSFLNGANNDAIRLSEYGAAGWKVAEVLVECLNLQPSQEAMLTTTATFGMLGGDSLAATRVTRALYAYHHKVANSRFLGGEFGKLTGPFDVINLLHAKDLGSYVDLLDSQNFCKANDYNDQSNTDSHNTIASRPPATRDELGKELLYDALVQATSFQQTSIALSLLSIGADPNHGNHSGRLGKITDRLKQRSIFRSSPLHLACLQGNDTLVARLLEKDAKFNSPDASGSFPLHLASSRVDDEGNETKEDKRLRCLQLLVEAGAPITMRDGNKQSVLHIAARAGHCHLLEYVMMTWKRKTGDNVELISNHFFNWNDRWYRTPVHWAILNGKLDALKLLLEMGCNTTPPKPKTNNQSSAAVESPLEMCNRLYGSEFNDGKGAAIRKLLLAYTKQNK